MSNSSSSSNGVGVPGLLLVAFIVLKLTGYINWSWLWVLSPIWISISFVVLFSCVYILIQYIKARKQKKAAKKTQEDKPKKILERKSKFQIKLEEMAAKKGHKIS